MFCTRCVEGSGKLTGHRGPHLKQLKQKIIINTNELCQECAPNSGKLIGHIGPHKKKRSYIPEESSISPKKNCVEKISCCSPSLISACQALIMANQQHEANQTEYSKYILDIALAQAKKMF